MILSRPNSKFIAYMGIDVIPDYINICRKYASSIGYDFIFVDRSYDFYKASDILKYASLCIICNGYQWQTPLLSKLCKTRKIPHVYIEMGMLPQSETFLIDPKGFCGDSILNESLHWVTDEDRNNMKIKRAELQYQYPLQDEGFILVPLQKCADTQVLFNSSFNTMEELIEYVEYLYPNDRIIARPHPRGRKNYKPYRTEIVYEGDFLHWASRASRVVGITSTTLYEAGILGVPVTALGDHPLNTHPAESVDDVLSGAFALTINRKKGNLKYILDRFNIEPL